MGKCKENPRYIVLSFRVSDGEKVELNSLYQEHGVLGQSFTDFCRELFLKGIPSAVDKLAG